MELFSTKKELENSEKNTYLATLWSNSEFLEQLPNVETATSHLSEPSINQLRMPRQDRFTSLDSGLKLDDGSLRVSRIMKEKIGSLAFLCACETAMGDEITPG